MLLTPAICTQCGANIQIDASKEAGICNYCGAAFITQKAINNYNNFISIQNANINITSFDSSSLFFLAQSKFEEGKYPEAIECCDKLLGINIADSSTWKALIQHHILINELSIGEKTNEKTNDIHFNSICSCIFFFSCCKCR